MSRDELGKRPPAAKINRLAARFVGRVITAIELEDDATLTLVTKEATLRVVPTRYETLSVNIGAMETVTLADEEAVAFLAGRTVEKAMRNQSSTTLFFTTGEELTIDARPHVEFGSRPTYTVTRFTDEEITL